MMDQMSADNLSPDTDTDEAQDVQLVTAAADAPLFEPPPTSEGLDDGEESVDFTPAGVQRLLDGKVRVSPASVDELLKIGQVYVAPPGHGEAARILGEYRQVHLVGPDHVGKFATAHALARRQREAETSLRIRTLRCSEDASILDILEDADCPPQSIFIIRDAFGTPGLQRNDFRGALGPLQETLDKNDQYIILTTDSELPTDIPTGRQQTVDVLPLPEGDLSTLLEKHFIYYSIPDEWWPTAIDVASKSLEHPYQYDLFAMRLQRLEARPRKPQLEVIVRDIKDSALNVRVWFNGLNPNQRYFAMLVCLLPGLSLDDLWQLYEKLFVFLKGQGIRLDPPLNYGREDLLESIQARRSEFGTVEFNSPIFAQGALTQAQYNYREQFRLLLPKFAEALESSVLDKRRGARDRQLALTTAISLLGQADLGWVRPILFKLAQHAEHNVRVAAAAVLRRICDVETQQPLVANLLAGWASDKDRARVRWTAAAAYSKLPRTMVTGSLKTLGKLAADNDFVRNEAAYALEHLFPRAPDDVIAALNDWLVDGDLTVASTVRKAVRGISNDSRIQASHFREAARQDAFWPLLDNIIRLGSTEQAKAGLSLLRSWLDREGNNDQNEALEEKMLATARMLGEKRHALFKNTLSEWLNDAPPMTALYLSAANLSLEIAHIHPMLEIDESDLEDVWIVVDDDDLLASASAPAPSSPTSDPIGIVWLDEL